MSILKPFSAWTCTDADNLQLYRKREADLNAGYALTYYWREFDSYRFPFLKKFLADNYDRVPPQEFEVIWKNEDFWVTDIIYPDSLKNGEILDSMEAYYTMDEIVEFIKNKDWLIITECVFEQTNELY